MFQQTIWSLNVGANNGSTYSGSITGSAVSSEIGRKAENPGAGCASGGNELGAVSGITDTLLDSSAMQSYYSQFDVI